ncbi:MAG: DoxX family membrane protein [Sphingobacteriales bacterium]
MPVLGKNTPSPISDWKARNGINILRISLGIVFLWFGLLKFFSGVSPAEDIAGRTIFTLTFGLIKPSLALPLLAVWECTIGLGLITRAWLRLTLILLYFQMAGTFLPILFFPHETFRGLFIPTLLGQYIIKNFVLISAGIVLGAALNDRPQVKNARKAGKGKVAHVNEYNGKDERQAIEL